MEDVNEDVNNKLYWDGNFNRSCRYWFYFNKGIDIFNQFKYLFALFLGIYFTLKLKNPLWLLAMTAISIPVLLFLGYLQVHKVGRVLDYLNIKFSTHYSLYSIKLQEDIRNAVRKIANIDDKILD